jgi:hypothetical protein
MSAQDAERAAALERRYQRLLRCYPRGHRQVHREEMLGVLLAIARPGQRTPGARQAVNLVDALAVVSLIAPAVMLIIATLDFASGIGEAMVELRANPEAGPFWQPWHGPFLGGSATVMIGWFAVVLLGLTGRRRAAAAIASIALALGLLDLLAVVLIQQSRAWSGGLPMFLITAGQGPVFIASLAACSLAFTGRPAARPGDREEAACLPHDRGPFRSLRGA